jgi:hypothetical protein
LSPKQRSHASEILSSSQSISCVSAFATKGQAVGLASREGGGGGR